MATVEQYAASMVEKYRVVPDPGSAPHQAADELTPLLKQWGKEHLLGITLSGAYAKNTAITLASHVDMLVALSSVPGMEMKEIFWSLFEFLTDHDLGPRARNVSMQWQSKGLAVDVIPACREGKAPGRCCSTRERGRRCGPTWPSMCTWWRIRDGSRKSAR
jgi:hypothetical protein